MRSIALSFAALAVTGLVLIVVAGAKVVDKVEVAPDITLLELAELAVSEDEALAGKAVERLRDAGQPGLDALFMAHSLIAERAVTHARCEQPETNRWRCAVDTVARQRDAAFSRLYWHTDLEQATAIAAEQNKPILTLRMLGELHEEYSCANSRYFRTVLYADPSVADVLRDKFVLHWKTVRPVPRITIDMGNGHRIDRTITGNSVHYVLNSEGRVLDVIPGLWDAASFRAALDEAQRGSRAGGSLFGNPGASSTAKVPFDNAPTFDLSKSLGERSMLAEVRGGGGRGRSPALASDPADASTATYGEGHEPGALGGPATSAGDIKGKAISLVSSASQRLMWQKRFGANADRSNPDQQRVMQSMISAFQRSLAQDTAYNREQRRPVALRWLQDSSLASLARDVEKLNERVYAELFLSPLDDPWMGLVPDDAYAGLMNEGLIVP